MSKKLVADNFTIALEGDDWVLYEKGKEKHRSLHLATLEKKLKGYKKEEKISTSVRLTQTEQESLKEIGDGSIGEGCRRTLNHYLETKGEKNEL